MMTLPSPEPTPSTPKRWIPLRVRFAGITAALLILLLGTIAVTLGYWQSRTIKKRLEERGLDIANSLAVTSINTLMSYNYPALEQLANEAAQDAEIVYVIVHDKEGRIAGYSGRPDLQREQLSDDVSRKAAASRQAIIQKADLQETDYPVMDVAVPVTVSPDGVKWGTIRVGLSYAAIYRQVRQLTAIILAIGILALCFGVLAAFWSARRITRPLKRLVHATVEATHGDLDQAIDIHTSDEIEILADNFTSMMREILRHKQQLESRLAEIQHMQKYTDSLLTTMNDGLLSFSMAGEIKSINPAASRLLDLPESPDVTDASIWSMIGGQDSLQRYVRQKMADPKAMPHEEIPVRLRDHERILIVGSSVLENETGVPEEVILNLHDITRQKKMEARVRQAERLAALGTLAAGMAHEIRNPLSAIKTFTQLLPRKLSKPGFLEKFNRTVPREINRINLLVEDLLDLAREPRYDFIQTDIRSLVEQNLDVFEPQLSARQIRLHKTGPNGLPLVSADTNQLSKAIQNFLRNALQAMPDGGKLTIDMQWERHPQALPSDQEGRHGWVVIGFEDTGVGIDEAVIGEIFNPFFTSKDQGTGLGLAISHKVITEHGGHIEVSSRLGVGTRFNVYLKALPPSP